jgi:YVTN family beta-propeller protein
LFAVILLPAPFARTACPCGYIPNSGSSSVSVIDLTGNTVTTTITGITGSPWGAAVNSAGTRVFVTRKDANAMVVIDATSNTVIGTVNGLFKPYSAVVHPSGATVYVTNSDVSSNSVAVVNTATNLITATIPLTASNGREPYGIAISPDGSTLYVANSNASATGASTVSVIRTSDNTVLGSFTGFSSARGVAVNRSGTRLYVSDFGFSQVMVYAIPSNSFVTTITTGIGLNPEGIAVSPNDSPVYAASYKSPGTVAVINAGSNIVTGTISVGAFPLGVFFHPGGGAAYVVNNSTGSNSVSVVSVPTSSVTGTISVQTAPAGYGGLAVLPPRISALSDGDATPVLHPVNSGAFTLTVSGTMFHAWPGQPSQVRWNGSPRTTTFVNPQQLTAAITAADVAVAGDATVTVNNPAPGGGASNGLTFTICTGPPGPANSLRVTKQSPDVRLGWIDLSGASPPATGYNVKAQSYPGNPAAFPVLGKPVVNGWNDPVLATAASYWYAIESYNGCTFTP